MCLDPNKKINQINQDAFIHFIVHKHVYMNSDIFQATVGTSLQLPPLPHDQSC